MAVILLQPAMLQQHSSTYHSEEELRVRGQRETSIKHCCLQFFASLFLWDMARSILRIGWVYVLGQGLQLGGRVKFTFRGVVKPFLLGYDLPLRAVACL